MLYYFWLLTFHKMGWGVLQKVSGEFTTCGLIYWLIFFNQKFTLLYNKSIRVGVPDRISQTMNRIVNSLCRDNDRRL